MSKTETPPRCAYCRKPFPKRTDTVKVPKGTILRTKAEVQRQTNQIVTSVRYDYDSIVVYDENEESRYVNDPKSKRADRYEVWDGESYLYYGRPFCRPKCAGDFAEAAYRAGYRMIDKTR